MRSAFLFCMASFVLGVPLASAEPALILTNHLGYDPFGPKRAVIRGTADDEFTTFVVKTFPDGIPAFQGRVAPGVTVDHWRNWLFWSLDFSGLEREGTYVIESANRDRVVRSFPFRVERHVLERFTISDVAAYFKAVRVSGVYAQADRHIAFQNSTHPPIDASGGWYDATGDVGVHFSGLDFAPYFSTQQVPLVALNLGKTLETLTARQDPNFGRIRLRLADELAYGADFLVRMRNPDGSFYASIDGYAGNKSADARRIVSAMGGFELFDKNSSGAAATKQPTGQFNASFRHGGGFAIAALAAAARLGEGGDFDRAAYLKAAEEAFAYLEAHNTGLLPDRQENIIDDYCALAAATELFRTTGEPAYGAAAERRALSLMARLTGAGLVKDYWRADGKDRPFFNPADAGAPVVALLDYYNLAAAETQARIKDAVRRSLEFELRVTGETSNPFGLARQYVQTRSGERHTSFFFPHDTEAAPWWQGENARLASLAAAARLAVPLFEGDAAFQAKLQGYALDQLNWILGLNPFDACMLQGTGRNNPEYLFFGSWQYRSTPGGIVNGITSGFQDEHNIDFNLASSVTGQDSDWRWAEQWLPHAAWYLLAAAAGETGAPAPGKVVIAYVFNKDQALTPDEIAPEKLTHINYAFANIVNGEMVEGFAHDAENFRTLNALKAKNPKLKVLVSVGGWTWSGNFSDMALTAASRQRFIASAVAFLRRHQLDGLDIDWEFPGQEGMNNVHRPEDRENSTALLREMRAALDQAGKEDGKRYLLTMAVQAADAWLEHTEMGHAQAYLDYINLMAYDAYGPYADSITGHHAALYANPADPKQFSAATMVSHFIAAGVPAGKIVLGVPFYGHAWADVAPAFHGLYQPGKPPGQTAAEISTSAAGRPGFTRYWDAISEVPFLYNAEKRIFYSYEDAESIAAKARYVVGRGLAGMMFWEYHGDKDGTLLRAIDEGLKQQ